MDSRPPLSGQAPPSSVAPNRLDGWKAIAATLRKDIRTAQRWERTEQLPVHRSVNSKRGSVFAYQSELEEWWKTRHPILRHVTTPMSSSSQKVEVHGVESTYLRALVYSALIIVGLFVIGVGRFLLHPVAGPAKTQARDGITLAVLPFETYSQDPGDRNLAANISHDVITDLENNRGFHVITLPVNEQSRFSALLQEQFVEKYHVQEYVEGSVTRSGDNILVAMQLIDASTGRNISSDQFARSAQTGIALEGDISRLIADSVRASLLPRAHAR